jgi:hypothetical protein
MPDGKPAGIACIHLTIDMNCAIYLSNDRPRVCNGFNAEILVCGNTREEAIKVFSELEGFLN